MWRKEAKHWVLLILALAMVRHTPGLVERIYATGIYRIIRTFDLFFLQWVPFSVGDVLYVVAPVWAVVYVWRLYRKTHSWKRIMLTVSRGIRLVILWFYLLWGLNYFREPLYRQWKWEIRSPDSAELRLLALREIDSLNRLHCLLQPVDSLPVDLKRSWNELQYAAAKIYRQNARVRPRLSESFYVVKPSLLARPVSRLGTLGYLNPFTHESQVNTLYPKVFLPHIILHELSHQIGYAYENEAEFIAFWEAVEAGDTDFRYSAHLTAASYLLGYWKARDSLQFEKMKQKLLPGVWAEYRKARRFAEQYRMPVDLSFLYDWYLRTNQQGKGMVSYGEMVLYLHTYYKEHDCQSGITTPTQGIEQRKEHKEQKGLNQKTADVE